MRAVLARSRVLGSGASQSNTIGEPQAAAPFWHWNAAKPWIAESTSIRRYPTSSAPRERTTKTLQNPHFPRASSAYGMQEVGGSSPPGSTGTEALHMWGFRRSWCAGRVRFSGTRCPITKVGGGLRPILRSGCRPTNNVLRPTGDAGLSSRASSSRLPLEGGWLTEGCGVFCYDSGGYQAYLVMNGVRANTVGF